MRAFLRRIPVLVRLYGWLRRGRLRGERSVFLLLALATIAIGVAATVSETWFPASGMVLTVLAGGLLLRVRALTALLAWSRSCWRATRSGWAFTRVGPGVIATVT